MPRHLLVQVGARDRALMLRCALPIGSSPGIRVAWIGITHLGGTGPSLIAAGLPWFAGCELHEASRLAVMTVVLSHLVVQLIKRTVSRRRPVASDGCTKLVQVPDPFSFPSGHATASMAVAVVYGSAFPVMAGPLLFLAFLVGFSRVRLGVHYPSHVLAGQIIAALTATILRNFFVSFPF